MGKAAQPVIDRNLSACPFSPGPDYANHVRRYVHQFTGIDKPLLPSCWILRFTDERPDPDSLLLNVAESVILSVEAVKLGAKWDVLKG